MSKEEPVLPKDKRIQNMSDSLLDSQAASVKFKLKKMEAAEDHDELNAEYVKAQKYLAALNQELDERGMTVHE